MHHQNPGPNTFSKRGWERSSFLTCTLRSMSSILTYMLSSMPYGAMMNRVARSDAVASSAMPIMHRRRYPKNQDGPGMLRAPAIPCVLDLGEYQIALVATAYISRDTPASVAKKGDAIAWRTGRKKDVSDLCGQPNGRFAGGRGG